MATFINPADGGFGTQLDNFCNKVDTYAATLGLDAAAVAGIKKDRDYYLYVLEGLQAFQTFGETMTAYKNLLRYGQGTDVLPAFPTIPELGVAPVLVAANVQRRFARLIQDCVNSANYTKTIGEDLGIEAPETPFDPAQGKPVFKNTVASAGHPVLVWKKGKFQGVEIWKNTGGGYQKLDRDLSPDYIDKSPLPPAGQSAVWKYKMIYIYKDEPVGQYSEEVAVTVYGAV